MRMNTMINSRVVYFFVFSFYDPKNNATYNNSEHIREIVHFDLLFLVRKIN